MTELTDEEAKALLAECDNPDCLTCEYARALLDARAELAQARADTDAAVALAHKNMAARIGVFEASARDRGDVPREAAFCLCVDEIRALAPADGLAAVEALRERAEKAEQERDAAVRGRNDWRDDFKALAAAIVGDTGLSAMTVAAQARTFRPRAEKAEADRDRLAEVQALRADRVKGQKDYCALMERHDAIAVELAAAKQREAVAYRDGWRFAYRQCLATGSVPDPDYKGGATLTPTDPGDGWTWNERLGWIGPDGKPADPRRRG